MRSTYCKPLLSTIVITAGLCCPSAANSNEQQELSIAASASPLQLPANFRAAKLSSLPALDIELALSGSCPAQVEAATLLISVADTRTTLKLPAQAEPSRTWNYDLLLTVPANQLVALYRAKACQPAAIESDKPALRRNASTLIRGAVSVQGSLICPAANKPRVVYASDAVDVELLCPQGPDGSNK